MGKRIAIVTAGFAPVPAVKGGAVETLVTQIIEQNEKVGNLSIDLFTIEDTALDSIEYKNTCIIQVKEENQICSFIVRCFNRICKILNIQIAYGINDRRIADVVNVSSYDAVVIENNMHIYQLLYKKNPDYKFFCFHLHNSIDNDPGKSYIQCKLIADTARSVIVVSNYIRNQFLRFRTENIYTLYNSVDSELFKPLDDVDNIELRKQLNINIKSKIILYCGRLTPEKGLLELIQAVKKISDSINVSLLIAGKNWFGSVSERMYASRLKAEIDDLEWIRFIGYIPNREMNRYYSLADITVVPSIVDEAFGMSALESLLCMTPVICTDRGGLSEVVDNHVGRIVQLKNLQTGLANMISLLLQDEELYDELKRNSRKMAMNKFENVEVYYNHFCKYL